MVSFYGLWDPLYPETAEHGRVFTMLTEADDSPSVPFKAATLAHVWPSALHGESDAMRRLLGLPAGFHVQERNFLVLSREAETAVDNDALLLLPARAALPAPPAVRARVFRLDEFRSADTVHGAAACEAAARLAGRALFLPRATQGGAPFLRLLAWKAVSALRAGAEHDDEAAAAAYPQSVALDASLEGGEGARRAAGALAELLSVGLVFGFGRR